RINGTITKTFKEKFPIKLTSRHMKKLLVVSNNKTIMTAQTGWSLETQNDHAQYVLFSNTRKFPIFCFSTFQTYNTQELNLGIKKLLHEVLEKVAQKEGEERFGFTHQAEKEETAEKLA
ncbi:hypothetical protein ACJX0J_042025, partial [Zea mays]